MEMGRCCEAAPHPISPLRGAFGRPFFLARGGRILPGFAGKIRLASRAEPGKLLQRVSSEPTCTGPEVPRRDTRIGSRLYHDLRQRRNVSALPAVVSKQSSKMAASTSKTRSGSASRRAMAA